MDYETARQALTEMADSLPRGIFRELNGGIVLIEDEVRDANGIYILGHYHFQPQGLGRYISIYYGSVMVVYGNCGEDEILARLRGVLHHELTHHIEHLAGDKTLEHQDEEDMRKILSSYNQGGK